MTTITLSSSATKITSSTDLKRGFMLTNNVSLDALTVGVVNGSTYPYKTVKTSSFPDVLTTDSTSGRTIPIKEKWKIATNLQYLATGVLEPLISKYSDDVTIFSGFVNPQNVSLGNGDIESKHFTGEAVDIYLNSKEGNMFVVANDIKSMLGSSVTEFGLIFSSRSWIHLAINGPYQANGYSTSTSQRIYTQDLDSGQYFKGIFPSRGTFVPSTEALNKDLNQMPWGSFTKPPYVYL